MSDENHGQRELVTLDMTECLSLLRLESIGRLATTTVAAGAPEVVPVNFVLDGDRPVVRSHDSEILNHATARPVSLQVDRFDWFHRSGWSVLVQGPAEIIHPSADLEAQLDCWAPGPQPRFIRITPESITGRRIDLNQRPLDAEGYL